MKILPLIFLWILTPLFAGEISSDHKTVCLNMIVKDENEVITKCLESTKPLIDYWVIVDTGSTDGTQETIRKCMENIPGELHERAWVNFEHNRNEALDLAKEKSDYILFIDADEYFICDKTFNLDSAVQDAKAMQNFELESLMKGTEHSQMVKAEPIISDYVSKNCVDLASSTAEFRFKMLPLEADCYCIPVRQIGAVDFYRESLVKASLPWRWMGVLHEVLICPEIKSKVILPGITNICNTSAPSGRSKDPNKYLKDAALLEEALVKEPNNSRYVFYLGQSYWNARKLDLALKNYEKRAAMPSQDIQETFFSLYNCGRLKEEMGDYEGALNSYFRAYEFRPTRAEPLFHAAVIYRKLGNPLLGYLLTQYALTLPQPKDTCVEYATYDHACLIEFANCALLTKHWEEGLAASETLLNIPNLPEMYRQRIVSNISLAKQKL